jgi:hypothetical protein
MLTRYFKKCLTIILILWDIVQLIWILTRIWIFLLKTNLVNIKVISFPGQFFSTSSCPGSSSGSTRASMGIFGISMGILGFLGFGM